MDHIFQNIHGWFSFPFLYKRMVEKFDNASFVEVGTWQGRSAAFMAVEIANSNKNIKFYCVDTWEGSEEHQGDPLLLEVDGLYNKFLHNIEPVKDYINPIRKDSVAAASSFENESLDFVFIDASHDYENVKRDLIAWWPKIKKGGVFAGHDYNPVWPGVVAAVREFFRSLNYKEIQAFRQEECWCATKK